jgi:YgiT-type zinc finger domain-containing protein
MSNHAEAKMCDEDLSIFDIEHGILTVMIIERQKEKIMICRICGDKFEKIITDLPFKINQGSIVIIKKLPVWQCKSCNEYLIEDHVMEKLDALLKNVDSIAEVEILSYINQLSPFKNRQNTRGW